MKIRYQDLIEQTFNFPQEEFNLEGSDLLFHGLNLKKLIEEYGSPLKISYLPKIGHNINQVRDWFKDAIKKHDYSKGYTYCYCTKSSHFSFVLEQVLKENVSLETSFSSDLEILHSLHKSGRVRKDIEVVCNGFKTPEYLDLISESINGGFSKIIPVLDNFNELKRLNKRIEKPFSVGIRIASEEEPKFEFYTSRLGIGYKDIIPYYKKELQSHKLAKLRMLHFFINTGIKDTAYYWNELFKCLKVYAQLKKIAPELSMLNIGGGFPIKNSLSFEYDYAYMIDEIVYQVKKFCAQEGVEEPHLYTEFGSYTVGESGATLYEVVSQKKQNEKEKWNMINSSFMTTLPDAWALGKRFVMLPLNRWNDAYERVFLGGLTCDSDDYYNSEQHLNAIHLPEFNKSKPLYLGFFNTGAYQDSIGGYGGVHHCLVPQPKHILIDKQEGEIKINVFREEQTSEDVLKILGYI